MKKKAGKRLNKKRGKERISRSVRGRLLRGKDSPRGGGGAL